MTNEQLIKGKDARGYLWLIQTDARWIWIEYKKLQTVVYSCAPSKSQGWVGSDGGLGIQTSGRIEIDSHRQTITVEVEVLVQEIQNRTPQGTCLTLALSTNSYKVWIQAAILRLCADEMGREWYPKEYCPRRERKDAMKRFCIHQHTYLSEVSAFEAAAELPLLAAWP